MVRQLSSVFAVNIAELCPPACQLTVCPQRGCASRACTTCCMAGGCIAVLAIGQVSWPASAVAENITESTAESGHCIYVHVQFHTPTGTRVTSCTPAHAKPSQAARDYCAAQAGLVRDDPVQGCEGSPGCSSLNTDRQHARARCTAVCRRVHGAHGRSAGRRARQCTGAEPLPLGQDIGLFASQAHALSAHL